MIRNLQHLAIQSRYIYRKSVWRIGRTVGSRSAGLVNSSTPTSRPPTLGGAEGLGTKPRLHMREGGDARERPRKKAPTAWPKETHGEEIYGGDQGIIDPPPRRHRGRNRRRRRRGSGRHADH